MYKVSATLSLTKPYVHSIPSQLTNYLNITSTKYRIRLDNCIITHRAFIIVLSALRMYCYLLRVIIYLLTYITLNTIITDCNKRHLTEGLAPNKELNMSYIHTRHYLVTHTLSCHILLFLLKSSVKH